MGSYVVSHFFKIISNKILMRNHFLRLLNLYIKWLSTLIVLVCLYFYLRDKVDIDLIKKAFHHLSILEFLILFLFNFFLAIMKAYNWKIILKHTTIKKIAFTKFLFPILAAAPLNILLPARGGEVIRIIYLKKEIMLSSCIGSLIFERLTDFGCLIFISFVCSFFIASPFINKTLIGVLFFFIIVFLFYLIVVRFPFDITKLQSHYFNNIISSLKKLHFFFQSLKSQEKEIVKFLINSLGQWLITILQSFLIFKFICVQVPFFAVGLNVPIGILFSLLPISIGGLGTREACFLFLFKDIILPENIIVFSAIFYMIRYLIPFITGLPFLILLKKNIDVS